MTQRDDRKRNSNAGTGPSTGRSPFRKQRHDDDDENGDSAECILLRLRAFSVDNISDPERGGFLSDTCEIIMRSLEHLLKVKSPRMEAVTLEAGKQEVVGVLTVESSSVPACVAVCSATSEPVAVSRRMVLIYSTEMVDTKMMADGPTPFFELVKTE